MPTKFNISDTKLNINIENGLKNYMLKNVNFIS